MSDKKNIDRLFQEKFKDFEVAPNDALWDRVSESLPNKKKKRRVIALWWQIGGVAAAIALLFTVGVTVFSSDETNFKELPIVNTEGVDNESEKENSYSSPLKNQNNLKTVKDQNTKIVDSNLDSEQKSKVNDTENETSHKANPSNQLTTPKNSNQKSNAVANSPNKNKANTTQKQNKTSTIIDKTDDVRVANQTKTSDSNLKTDTKTQLASEAEQKSAIKKSIEDTKTIVAENTRPKLESQTSILETNKTNGIEPENLIIENPELQTIENAIAENNETIDEEEKEDERSRWSIAPNVAPVYFNSFGKGSSLDKQFNENSKSSEVNMSYGIAGSYAVSKKLKIRAGVNRVNLNQTTSDVFAFVGAETASRGVDASFSNISFSSDEQQVSLMSSKSLNMSSTPELFNTQITGEIDQRFGFIEIPLELEYRLLDTKFGINVIGGFSTFFLSENEIYADINGSTTSIGEANNINDTSFSANFGLGMDYSLSRQWNINLEPTFKYQINTFNNTTGDFKPFFIGVYTGLSFKF
ncbi:hypothetical protein ADIWIN_0327 [Winogradskyella psychrotolerans RS-3]|uniref:Outer membrane protein beta-barrel domain-containing protein n=1 Tax=Winogradskyella psychrotolerans RS-3 TaxID=641526 RepID=S7VWB6_9FLAO|nr:hypothetical protein [Winogradskyella psychrotolerans]EPR74575.1 hypothetical protein ADIWIN_0327 [Winogradskyella psychrotolerans RS-3]